MAGVPGDPLTWWVATAAGCVWKSKGQIVRVEADPRTQIDASALHAQIAFSLSRRDQTTRIAETVGRIQNPGRQVAGQRERLASLPAAAPPRESAAALALRACISTGC